jgi:aminopeptidase N
MRFSQRLFLTLFCVLPCLPLSAQQSDSTAKKLPPTLPPAQWQRPRTLDVKHIALNLRFDWQKKQAFGTAKITLAPLSTISATQAITLDAAMMTINAITLSDGKSLKFDYENSDKNNNLKIYANRTIAEGEDITLTIDYRTNWVNVPDPNSLGGSTGKGLRFYDKTAVEPRKRRHCWSMAELNSNRYWFPGYDDLGDTRTSEITATVPKPLSVISNGKLLETRTNADGTRTFHWKMDTPHANYQTSIAIGEFHDIPRTASLGTQGNKQDAVEVHTYGFPDEKAATEASTERLADMVKFFSEKTGVKYPFAAYNQVVAHDLPWGMAGIGTSTLSENMIDDFGTHADFLYLWDWLEGEALAHQWFGNAITVRDWSDIWLHRAFSLYFSNLYCEYKNGREEFLLYNHGVFSLGSTFGDWNGGLRRPVVTKHYESAQAIATDNFAYFRGAVMLNTLRQQLGERKWWRAIQGYAKANTGKQVTTEDFRKACEDAAGEPLDWFFDQWIYGIGHPKFVVNKSYDAASKRLTLSLKQTQQRDSASAYPQTAYFQGKMAIELDGRVETVWLEPKAENTFTFAAEAAPKLVNVDYENAWLKEITFEKSLDELLYQLQNDADITGRRWAMGELSKLAKNEKTTSADKERIYAGFRAVATGKSYWRLKYMAILGLQGLLAPGSLSALSPSAPPTKSEAVRFDDATISMLLTVIKNEKAWTRAAAINFLGLTCDPKFADLYIGFLTNESDRVVNAAANALGKCKSPKAFDALVKLKDKPSWKNQSLISTLNGLKALKDPRGVELALTAFKDLASPRWTLAVPIWDYRIAAAETLVALGKADSAYPFALDCLKKAIADDDMNDIFNTILLITTLADPRGDEAFTLTKAKLKDDTNAMTALGQFEEQFKEAVKKK